LRDHGKTTNDMVEATKYLAMEIPTLVTTRTVGYVAKAYIVGQIKIPTMESGSME
jgi:hypothetical protein